MSQAVTAYRSQRVKKNQEIWVVCTILKLWRNKEDDLIKLVHIPGCRPSNIRFMNLASVLVHRCTKKELSGQYLAILTSYVVNNPSVSGLSGAQFRVKLVSNFMLTKLQNLPSLMIATIKKFKIKTVFRELLLILEKS